MVHRLNASTIKSWFQYRCERKVRYETAPLSELEAVPVARDLREQSWAQFGVAFERAVMDRLGAQQGLLRPFGDSKDGLSERLALAFLRGVRPEPYAAQINLRPASLPPTFKGVNVELSRTFPDLVRREAEVGRAVFTIADVKATRRATTFHKAQVAYYVRLLEQVLHEIGIAARLSPRGEIWRLPDVGDAAAGDWQVETFALAPYLRLVDEFCAETLPRILERGLGAGVDETLFHVYFKCEQCNFLPHCMRAISAQQPPERRDISAVAGLSHEAKRSLERLNIQSVARLSKAHGLTRTQGLSWSLSRKAETLVARANALAEGQVQRTQEEHTYLMPGRADVRFFISVDHDPIDDRVAALGYRRVEAGVTAAERIEIVSSGEGQAEIDAIARVLGALLSDLSDIDTSNEARADGSGRYAHIFFYEPAEAANLQAALGRHLNDQRIRTGLLDLIRLFPPEDIVPEPEFRGIHHLPATAVRSVLEQLYALPVSVAYDLRQTSAAIAAFRETPTPYAPNDMFTRPFSSLLSIDVIRALKDGKDSVTLEDVEADVRSRLNALQANVEFLYEAHARGVAANQPLLRLAKRPFRFQASFDPLNAADLDVLTACELLENRAGMLDTLVRLAQPQARRVDSAQCLGRLSLTNMWRAGGKAFLAFSVPDESRVAEIGPGDFGLILTDDDADLRLDPTRWPFVSCRIEPPRPGFEGRFDRVLVSMATAQIDGPIMQGLLRTTTGDGWFVDKSFNDVNTGRAVNFLRDLAGAP